jgi:glycosyltransferase involved in cell wall biosynthesis
MELIFLCGLFPKNRETEIYKNSKNIIHTGPNNLQWTFVSGLEEHFSKFTIITTPLLTNFPKGFRKLFFWGSIFHVNKNIEGICLGSIRLPIIGLVSKFLNMFFLLIKKFYFKKNVNILVYSVHIPYLFAAVFFKLFNPSTKICLFVNDLPQFMSDNKNRLYLFFKSIEVFIFNRLQKNVDSYIFVTSQTNSLINLKNKPWALIEGVYNVDESHKIDDNLNDNTTNIILYTGTLDSRYGLQDLIDAFFLINNKNYELWICGDGDLKDDIINLTSTNNKIKYLGLLSHQNVIKLQLKATVLVNPRKPFGEYTKYSFPIKTLEYLAAGKPCIMYDLPGIPRDYLKYIVIPEDESVNSLKAAIIDVCEWDLQKRIQFCRNAFEFIKNNKSSKVQFAKLSKLIES